MRWRRWLEAPWRTIRGRILLAAVSVEILMLALVVGNALSLVEERLSAQVQVSADRLTPILNAALVAPLAQMDTVTVRAILDEAWIARGLDYVAVEDRWGHLLAVSGWPKSMPLPPPDPVFTLSPKDGDLRFDVVHDVTFEGQALGRLHFGIDLAPIIQARDEVLRRGTLIGGLCVMLSAVALQLIGLWLTRRLGRISDASRALAAGRRDVPPLPEGDDDLGRLGAAFNRMSERVRARDESSEEWLRLAYDFANIGSWEYDFLTREVHHSERLPQLLGFPPGDHGPLDADTLRRQFHPDDRDAVIAALARSRQFGMPFAIEYRIIDSAGQIRWLFAHGAVIADSHGRPRRLVGIAQDIQARKQVEAALRASESRFREMVQNSPVAYLSMDRDGVVVDANETLCVLLGRDLGAILGQPFGAFWSPATRDAFAPTLHGFLASGAVNDELDLLRGDGETINVLIEGRVQYDSEGRFVRTHCALYDITERKKIEAKLRKLSAAVEQSPAAVVITDREGRIEYVNRTLLSSYGYTLDEVLGQTPRMFSSGERPPDDYRVLWDTILSGEIWQGEFRNRRKNGSLLWVSSSVAPLKDSDGRISHFLAIMEDISTRKAAEAEIEENRRRLTEAQRFARLGSWEYDPLAEETFWSEVTFELFGLDPATFVPRLPDILTMIHPEDRPLLAALDRHLMTEGSGETTLRVIRTDGEERFHHLRGRATVGPDGQVVRLAGTVQDVTEREQASAASELFHRLVDNAGQAIRIADPQGRIVFVNPALLAMTGYRADELIGRSFTDLMADPDGESARALARAYAAGEGWQGLIEVRRADGTSFMSRCTAGVVLDAQRRPQHLYNIFSDYTLELARQTELSDARDAAEEASRAKTAFLASMSHELRTPMNAILGFSQFLEMDPALSPQNRDSVATILKAGHHLLDLINDILDLARIESGRIDLSIEAVPLASLLRESMDLIAPLAAEHGLATRLDPGPESLTVEADWTRFKQVMVNLLGNAVKYNRPAGEIAVGVEMLAGNRVRISVSDTGIGIPAERLAELFIPFNRLGAEHSETEGTGIGLALSRRIVEAMGATIGVESEPGHGSRFWIDLACAAGADAADPAPRPETAPADGPTGALALYIEDNPVNLKLVEQVFARHGHLRLISAPTPGLGLDLARSHHPDLILLDINLPGINGYSVLARLRADPLTRDIPVMAISAMAMARDIERGRAAGFDAYLTKPIDIPSLLHAVETLLTRADPPPARLPGIHNRQDNS